MSLFEVICKNCGSVSVKLKPVVYPKGGQHVEATCKDCQSQAFIPQNQDADEFLMPFGKYRGNTILEVCQRDPRYASWLLESGAAKNKMAELVASTLEALKAGQNVGSSQ